MRIDEIIAAGREPVFSFEFFPPKTEEGERNLQAALEELRPLEPSYVSVTYGAGGSTRDRTIEIVKRLKDDFGLEAMAHLSCVGTTREQLREILDEVQAAGIDNVLALRGDPPRGETEWKPTPGGLHYSTELAALIREHYDFCVGAACFPEVHPEAPDLAHDLRFLKEKVAAGATFLISQLFFDNRLYFDFVEEARAAGIALPIVAGIIPVTNVDQIKRFTSMCGASIPAPLLEQLELRRDDPDAVIQFGVAYATLQCADLLARGAPGIHFYTLNKSPATRAILSALKTLRPWEAGGEPALQAGGSMSSAWATSWRPSSS
jgi:methylenetetrahydrofolate reductase (NADPH)